MYTIIGWACTFYFRQWLKWSDGACLHCVIFLLIGNFLPNLVFYSLRPTQLITW